MTFYRELKGDARKAYELSTNLVFEEAQLELGIDPDGLVIRDADWVEDYDGSSQLGQGDGPWKFGIAGTLAPGTVDWSSAPGPGTVDDSKFFAIYGLSLGTGAGLEAIQQVIMDRGNRQVRLWPIRHLANEGVNQSRIFYADDPVTAFQLQPMRIQASFGTFDGSLGGTLSVTPLTKVVEPEGLTIAK